MERGAPPAVVPTVIMPSAHPPELRSAGKISTSKWLSNHSNHSNLASDDEDAMHRRANPRRGPSRESQPGGRARRSDSNVSRGDDGYGSGPAAPTGRATRSRASLQSAPAASPTPEPEPQPRTLRARKSVIKDDEQDDDVDGEGEPDPDVVMPANDRARRSSGRIRISSTTDDEEGQRSPRIATTSTRGRSGARSMYYDGPVSDESSDGLKPPRLLRRSRQRNDEFVENDDDFDQNEVVDEGYGVRRSSRHADTGSRRMTRSSNRRSPSDEPRGRKNDAAYDESTELSSSDDEDDDEEDEDDEDEQGVKKTYTFRQRAKKVNYFLPPVNTFDMLPTDRNDKGKGKGKAQKHSGSWLPPNMSTAQYAALYPEKARDPPDSDDDNNEFPSPRKTNLFSTRSSGFQGSGMLAGAAGQDVPGAPNNLGKITATLADTDPLGVASNISFDSVGGLGAHIQQLKEMVSLPLLYPEVFERFNITPPRGVLFHGPPGTGKTLLARALASSCSTEGRKISFFMRKGADCLSKWVGEAERQLRLLFEEAKACQPSIIFFDEIDGLAPVRSSKQDQVHASIVSTLLALMDGMDGRGQVIVIGATNRPDAIDPALRRPGRFDREFYFPLPNLEARRKILDIHTSGWVPPIEESFKDELAGITKGYGGADLRALCTEAALNAVQRTYPQIYKTNERLVIKPETIDVTARDFIVSQKNLIPSTARATSSSAAPIPVQLVPLLDVAFEGAKLALAKVLPDVKKPNVLEEAEWEDDGGGFEKEKMMQAFETLRVFRPRMLVCGEPGMGQAYIGAAILHHLEGFHVQSLDLATLVSDSGRTMEAACVQLFVEAKRHKPSILFIPSLLTWVQTVNDTVRMTIKGLLEGLDASDPILLLAVVDGQVSELPSDVRAWFGFGKGNRIMMAAPGADQRTAFFAEVMKGIARPPNEFPDAMPRRKRVLEVLPIAPPPPPRVQTAAEIQQLELADRKLLEYLKWRLGPVLGELKKRYKKFARSIWDEWRIDDLKLRQRQDAASEPIVGFGGENPYYNVDLDTMHMDLYKGLYTTPDAFLEDIGFILDNVEIEGGDIEHLVKVGQMVNHAKVMVEETFDDPFRLDCARMAERAAERERNKPAKKSKDRAAAIALLGGIPELILPEDVPDEGAVVIEAVENGMVTDALDEAERGVKRVREDGEEMMDEGEDGGPAKRARAGEEAPLGAEEVVSAVPPTALLTNGNPHVNGGTSSFQHLFDPSLSPMVATSSSFSSEPTFAPVASTSTLVEPAVEAVVTPVVLPAVVPPAPALASPPANSTIPPSASPVEPEMAASEVGVVPMDEGSPLTPVEDPPTPEPLPDFVLDEATLGRLAHFLTHDTEELNVDQLEQLRASCYDAIWTARKGWDRTDLVAELTDLAREFVDEVCECNGAM